MLGGPGAGRAMPRRQPPQQRCGERRRAMGPTGPTAGDGPTAGGAIPVASVQAVHRDFWLAKQVCLSAMVFLLAAAAAGLATCPMEGFGERAVRRALGIPPSQAVILLLAVGYADNSGLKKT